MAHARPMPRHQAPRGLTLIELLVVCAILALLASVAIPSYKSYIQRGQRGDARVALVRLAQFMERAATANGRYPLEAAVPSGVLQVEGGRYTLSLVSTDGVTYVATATRKTGTTQATDSCGDFRIDQAGNRTVENQSDGMTDASCWRR